MPFLFLQSLPHRQLGPRKYQSATISFQLKNSSRTITPSSPAPSSSSSSRTPAIIGGVIGGSIALAILILFLLVRGCLSRKRQSDQLPRFQQVDRDPVTSGRWQVEPFTNTAPGAGREKQCISESRQQGDDVARLQVQLRPATPPEASPLVVELHRRIQELAGLVSPPDYAEAPNS